MIRRDYIMKLVQQLFDSIFRLLNEKGLDNVERQEKLEDFYEDYLGESRGFYYMNDFDSIIDFLRNKYGDELIQRVEMLSEVMYQDAMLEDNADSKIVLLSKTLSLLLYLDEKGNTYSIVRQGKMDIMNKQLLLLES